jgi:hypothetical protein
MCGVTGREVAINPSALFRAALHPSLQEARIADHV